MPGAESAGMWGEPTALIDWCERNHAMSVFVAEWWNTVSNIAFLLAGYLVYSDAKWLQSLPLRLLGLSICLTGVCSAFFHASLWYTAWKSDELTETVTLILLLHISLVSERARLQVAEDPESRVLFFAAVHSIFAGGLLLWFPLVFCEVHLACVVVMVGWSMYKQHVGGQILWALGWAAAAFVCWTVDRVACEYMHSLWIGNMQLHAWWHVLVAVALHQASIVAISVYPGCKRHGRILCLERGRFNLFYIWPYYSDLG